FAQLIYTFINCMKEVVRMYGYQDIYHQDLRLPYESNEDGLTAFEYFRKPVLPDYTSELAKASDKQTNRFLQYFQDEQGHYDVDKIFDTIDDVLEIAKQYVPWLLDLLFIVIYMKES